VRREAQAGASRWRGVRRKRAEGVHSAVSHGEKKRCRLFQIVQKMRSVQLFKDAAVRGEASMPLASICSEMRQSGTQICVMRYAHAKDARIKR